MRAEVVHGGQVGMVEGSRGSGFLLEAAEAIGVLRERRRQDLDRHVASEARVARSIHFAHSARAEWRQDLVGAELRARRKAHVLRRLHRGDAAARTSRIW